MRLHIQSISKPICLPMLAEKAVVPELPPVIAFLREAVYCPLKVALSGQDFCALKDSFLDD